MGVTTYPVPNSIRRCEVNGDVVFGQARLAQRNGDARWVDLFHNENDTNPIDVEAVPDITGGDVAAAIVLLDAENLNLGMTATAQSTTVAIDDIISQQPVATTEVFTGAYVNAVISVGTAVPAAAGVLEATFLTSLTTAGLIAGTGTTANDPAVPVGDIISSDPVSGTLVEPGSAVDYVTSLGPV